MSPAGRRRLPAAAGWAVATAAVVGVFVAFGVLSDLFSTGPVGPANSSYATSAGGVAALAELLQRSGHPVTALRRELPDARLDRASTLFVLGPVRFSDAEVAVLRAFLGDGGRLVIGGGDPAATLPHIIPAPPRLEAPSARTAVPLAQAPETDGVALVRTAGAGVWRGGSPRGLLGRPWAPVLASASVGRGTIDLLADVSPLENRLLADADNAQLALDLAGPSGRPVAFAEAIHGYGEATGLAALPGRLWLALAVGAAAAGAWALARGRRLGPPEVPGARALPPRSAYVDAMADILMRAREP